MTSLLHFVRSCGAVTLALLLVLAGCASAPQQPVPPPDWQAHVSAITTQRIWQLNGKIGFRASSGSGSAFMTWQQRNDNYRMVLNGALGLGKMVLNGNRNGVSWSDNQGQSHHHPDPDELVNELWGWQIPVRALPFWVRGIPQPDIAITDLQLLNGAALAFNQAGWAVRFDAYRDSNGLTLPGRIVLEREGAVLTLLVNRWSAPP